MAVDPAELPGSTILHQVTNGVAVRMAVLFELLGSVPTCAGIAPIPPRLESVRDPHRHPQRHRARSTGERRADVAIADGLIVQTGTVADFDDALTRSSTQTAASSAPGSSTCTCTCASRARRRQRPSRRAAAPRHSVASPAVVAMPNTEPAHDTLATVDFVRRPGPPCRVCARWLPAGCITMGRAGRAAGPARRVGPAGVMLFTDDGNGVQDAALMRRALEYAGPTGHHARAALRGRQPDSRRRDARGFVLRAPRPARLAGAGRGADGAPRHRARPVDGSPVHLLPPVDRPQRRAGPVGQGRRLAGHAEAAPHHFTLTDECWPASTRSTR